MQSQAPAFGKRAVKKPPRMAELPTWQAPPEPEEPTIPEEVQRALDDYDPDDRFRRMAGVLGVKKEPLRGDKVEVRTTFWAGVVAGLAVAALQMGIVWWWPPKSIQVHLFFITYTGEAPVVKNTLSSVGSWLPLCAIWGIEFVLPIHLLIHPYLRALNRLDWAAYMFGGALTAGLMAGLWILLGTLPKGTDLTGFIASMGNKGPAMNGWFLEIMLGAAAGAFYRFFSGVQEIFFDLPKSKKAAGGPQDQFVPSSRGFR